MPDPETNELRVEQVRRVKREEDRARDADTGAAEQAHDRRAERAQYLRRKLDERAEAEDRAAAEDTASDED
jgi:hypothetical protein